MQPIETKYSSLFFLALGYIAAFCIYIYLFFLTPLDPNCLPVIYPDGSELDARNGKVTTYSTEVNIQDVASFFDKNLVESEIGFRSTIWDKRPIGEKGLLFECFAAANAYEAERGCIYVKETEDSTVITSVWSHYPDMAPLCRDSIDELKTK